MKTQSKTKITRRRGLVFTLLILLCMSFAAESIQAASGRSKKPKWIDSPSMKFPSELYLSGVGHGDNRQAAEDAAYAAISRIFQAKITSRTKEIESYLQTDNSKGTTATREISINQFTSVATNKVLADITIEDVWTDEKENLTYALAVMDRKHAAATLRERITRMDEEVELLLAGAKKQDIDKIQAIRQLHAALKALIRRYAYNTDLQVINQSGTGIKPKVLLAELRRELEESLLSDMTITIEVTGPYNDKIKAAISEGITKKGFYVIENDVQNSGDILIRVRVEFERGSTPRWKFIRWMSTIDLMNIKNGKIFGSLTKNGKSAQLDYPAAEAKAVRSIQKKIVGELSLQMVSLIYGD